VTAALIALSASLAWGVGDMAAALASRRHRTWSVVFVSQIAGFVIGLSVLYLLDRPFPGWRAELPALLGGVALAIGMVAYFEALAVGTMSVVAPIAATCGAVPVVFGLVAGERPSTIQALGMLLVFVGVVLSVYQRDSTSTVVGTVEVGVAAHDARRPKNALAAGLAVVAAVCFGLILVGIAAAAKHDPLWPPVAARITSLATLATIAALSGLRSIRRRGANAGGAKSLAPRQSRMPAGVWVGAVSAGALHLAAAILFILASQRGLLSLVAVLSSLSAVVVVGLAHLLLHERLEGQQLAGVILALTGAAAIAGG